MIKPSPSDLTATQWPDKFVRGFIRHWLVLLLTPLLIFVSIPFLAPVAMAAGWTGFGEGIYWLYSLFCHQFPQRSWFLFGPKLTYTLDEIHQVYPHTDFWRLRSFYGTPEMGWKVAWSDRMVSLYFMTPVFGMAYAAPRRWRSTFAPISWRILLLSLAPLTIDGGTHVINDLLAGVSGGGFRDTNMWLMALTGNAFPGFYAGDHFGAFNWWMRLATGLLAAWGLAFFVFPWLNRFFTVERERDNEKNHSISPFD